MSTSTSLPELCCVEVPAYSSNPKNLIDLVGGVPAIQRSFQKDSPLQLYLRPKDPFSHPIHGNVIQSGNLLIKLIKKRNKKTGEIKVDYEIVGSIQKTVRYRALADFQVLPDPSNPIVKLRKSMQKWNREEIDKFRFTYEKGLVDDLKNIPPPVFSVVQWAHAYDYKQISSAYKVLVQGGKDGSHSEVLVNRQSKRERLICHVFSNYKDPLVPTEPPKNFVPSDSVPQDAIEAIERLFEERPIWTRTAINNLLPNNYAKLYIKQLLPRVAYIITKGPWRDSWVRYGYDPRQETDAARFQCVGIRVEKRRTYKRGQKDGDSSSTPDNNRPHIFDGKTVCDVGNYQLCDITDPEVETKGKLRAKCSKTSGWYSEAFIKKVRKQVKKKIRKLKGEEIVSESEDSFTDKMDQDEDDEDQEESSADEEDDDEELAPEPEQNVSDRVRSKVNEMMRSLQAAQKDVQPNDALPEEDMEELEMFDVFDGDDSSSSEYEDS